MGLFDFYGFGLDKGVDDLPNYTYQKTFAVEDVLRQIYVMVDQLDGPLGAGYEAAIKDVKSLLLKLIENEKSKSDFEECSS